MASRHFSFKTGKAGAGAKHSAYIAGEGRYADRDDVRLVEDQNLPEWAKSADQFFAAADQFERSNGRAYSEIEFAIPREVADPLEYAKNYAQILLADRHVYRLAVHDKAAADGGRNIHGHLMFSERRLDGIQRDAEGFFKRANSKNPERGGCAKDRAWNDKNRIDILRRDYESHAKKYGVALNLRSNKEQGLGVAEPKIGPARKTKKPDHWRQARAEKVGQLRNIRSELVQLKKLEKEAIQEQQKAPAPAVPAPKPLNTNLTPQSQLVTRKVEDRAGPRPEPKKEPPLRHISELVRDLDNVEKAIKNLTREINYAPQPYPASPGLIARWELEAEGLAVRRIDEEFKARNPGFELPSNWAWRKELAEQQLAEHERNRPTFFGKAAHAQTSEKLNGVISDLEKRVHDYQQMLKSQVKSIVKEKEREHLRHEQKKLEKISELRDQLQDLVDVKNHLMREAAPRSAELGGYRKVQEMQREQARKQRQSDFDYGL